MQLGSRPRLVDQIDRLVGQKSIRDIAIGQFHGFHHRVIRNFHAVVLFIAITQALNDLDRFFHGRRIHVYGLEPTFEGAVFLDMFAVFIHGGGPDAVNLASGQRRLEHIGGIDRPFGRARANQGMQFVDEQDHVAGLHDLLHDHLQAFFKLPPILGPGDQGPQVQGDHAPVQEIVGHVHRDDALGQPFDDRSFSNAGFADESRVVLGTATQDLQHPFDFIAAADDGIQHGVLRQLREIPAEFIERGRTAFLVPFPGSRFPQEGHGQLTRRQQVAAQAAKHLPADPFFFPQQAQQEVFAPDVVVSQQSGFFNAVFDDFFDAWTEGNFPEGDGRPATGQTAFHLQTNLFGRQPHLLDDHEGNAIGFTENG